MIAALAAKLDQPDHPIGMGRLFVLIVVGFAVLFMVTVLIGRVRDQKRGPQEPFGEPVLLRDDKRRGRKK
ncbi:hypothetical protein G9U51_06215 [Calidifontibacter sp. DB0510]|uniref:Uncharacterized protein n=1 Tax=Metallococcus carri TaxID=1656884 RepID=A0A967B0U8_9MICO|nr:hypothetical protein [Metallococcus carri]NHN55378.1 hypothetical protein [Metallococcus carri]NOP36455.1 hypothetical protein [Calidifontibacter sp. DB2511S]